MTIHQDAYDDSQGNPNLEVLQRLKESWTDVSVKGAILTSETVVTASGGGSTAGIAVVIPVGAEIMDAKVICTSASSGGTVQLQTGTGTAITNAIACATDKALTRAGTVDAAYKFVTADGVIAVTNAEADAGNVYITYKMQL